MLFKTKAYIMLALFVPTLVACKLCSDCQNEREFYEGVCAISGGVLYSWTCTEDSNGCVKSVGYLCAPEPFEVQAPMPPL